MIKPGYSIFSRRLFSLISLVSLSFSPINGRTQTIQFSDVTNAAGITPNDPNGYGHGSSFGDFNGDGRPDIYMISYSTANFLFRNNGSTFTDIAASAGVQFPTQSDRGMAAADYDNDGDLDLYIAAGYTGNVLYRNNGPAEAGFTDVTSSAGVYLAGQGQGVAWGDYNGDKLLDLFVTQTDGNNVLFRQESDHHFTDVTSSAGIGGFSFSLQPVFFDVDGDGDVDLFVARQPNQANLLYINNGNGTFSERAQSWGIDSPAAHSQGAAIGDYDRDGDLDVYVCDYDGYNLLFKNQGNHFDEVSVSAGVRSGFTGNRGALFADFNDDGWLDLYVTRGGDNKMYQNNGNGTFSDVSSASGTANTGDSYSPSFADYDNDGDLDIFFSSTSHQNSVLYRNNGPFHNWLQIKLVGNASNRDGIGAKLTAWLNGQRQTQTIISGQAYLCTGSDLTAHFALASSAAVDSLIIQWPSGTRDRFSNLAANQKFSLQEGTGDRGGPDTTPPVISNVAAGGFTSTSATISWQTNEAADSQLEYGLTTSYGSSSSLNSSLVTSHTVSLSSLQANTTYHYRVKSKDAAGNLATSGDFTFTTLGQSSTIFADNFNTGSLNSNNWRKGTNTGNQAAVTNNALELRASGTVSGWVVTMNNYAALNTTVSVKVVTPNDDGALGISPTYNLPSSHGIYDQANWYRFYTYRNGHSGAYRLYAQWKKNGVENGLDVTGSLVINSIVYLRFRSDNTNIHFEASLDGVNWVDTYNEVFGLPGYTLSSPFYYELAGYNTESNGVLTVDDFAITNNSAPDTQPPVISNIASSNITTSAATITWTTNESSDTQVEYGLTTSYGSSSSLNTSLVTSHTVSLSSLQANTTYHYRVKSKDAAGNLTTSGDFTFTTLQGDVIPPVISNVTASNITSSAATINWTTNENSDSQVEYGLTTSYGSSSPLNSSLVTLHTVSLSSLQANTTYHYRVKSKDAAGNPATSSDFTFTTSSQVLPVISSFTPTSGSMGTPVMIAGSNFTGATSVTFNGTSAPGFTVVSASQIQVNVPAGATTGKISVTTAAGTATSAEDFAVVTALTLTFGPTDDAYVQSSSPTSSYGTSSQLRVRRSSSTQQNTYLKFDIAGLSGNVQSAKLRLYVIDDGSDGGNIYNVSNNYSGASTPWLESGLTWNNAPTISGSSLASAGAVSVGQTVELDVAAAITGNGVYSFAISNNSSNRVYYQSKESSNPPVLAIQTGSDVTPPTISNVTAGNLAVSSANITWVTNELADSQVEYGLTTSYGSSSPLNASLVTSHTVILSSLQANTTYHYRVKSKDAAGNLATSNDFTFTTLQNDVTPPVISNVASSNITSSAATITWTTNESSDSQVEYGLTTSYGSSSPLNSSLVTSHTVSLSSLQANTTYHYRVKSKDAAGNLATSGDFAFTTLQGDVTPPVISNVTASNITSSAATINWTTNESSDSQVEYGLTTSYGSSSSLNSSLVTSHTVSLSSLQANATYHYRVKSKDAAGNLATSGDFTFTTLGQSSTIFADNFNTGSLNSNNWRKGTNSGNQAAVVNNALELRSSGNVSGWIITANNYAALNTTVSVKVVTPNDDGALGISPTYNLSSSYGIYDQANWYRFYTYRNGHSGAYRLYAQWKKSGVENGLDVTGSLVINGTVYLHLRFDNTNIHFEASLDGVNWVDTYNEAFGLPGYTLNSPFYYELAGYNTESNGVLAVDDFAINSNSAPGTQPQVMTAMAAGNVAFANVEDIFANICARCHQGATAPAGLVLLPGQAYGNIISVLSTEYPQWRRVQPGNRAASWLFEKITNSAPPVGSKMGSLTADEIALIGTWIDQGATQKPVPPYADLEFRTKTLLNGEINISYNTNLVVWGGLPPYQFGLAGGTLPPGITLDAAGGIYGRPSTPGQYSFTIRVSDSQTPAATLEQAYSLEVFNTQDHWQLPAGFLIENVVSGLHLPVNIAFVPNPGPNPADPYFYVTLLYGDIVMVQRNFQKRTYATGLLNFAPTGEFPGSGEMGVTGVTVDPASGDVFASMTYDEGGFKFNQVARFHSTDGGHTAATKTVILSGIPAGSSHQIQEVTIGPDGKLYVNVGDAWVAEASPDLNDGRGKILRLNLDGSVPPDNPFANSRVYAFGVRNPFGAAWRVADGKLYISDNGPENNDRLVQILPGQDYGWGLNSPDLTKGAIFLWNPTVAPVAITFMDATSFPSAYRGQLFVGLSGPAYQQGYSLLGKKIQRFVLDENGNVVSDSLFLDYVGAGQATVIGVASGPDGLYFTDLYGENGFDARGQTQGNVYRIRWAAGDVTPPVISNVQVTNVTGAGATIVWQTDEPATRQVEYGLTFDYGYGTPYETNFVTSHSVTLTQLTPETAYHFRVWSWDAANNGAVSSDLTFTTTAIDSTPPIISAMRVDSISVDAALVQWRTNEPATSLVEFGATTAYGLSAAAGELITAHRMWLTGLTDTTLYHFRVRSRDASNNEIISNDSTFTTLLKRTLLADDFNGGVLNTLLWQLGTNAGNESKVANNALELSSHGEENGWAITQNAYAARHTVVSVKVVQPNDDGDLGVSPTYNLSSPYGIYDQANWYRFYLYRGAGAGSYRLFVQWKKNGVANEADVTGNLVINGAVYLRLRFDNTNIHFEASLDGAAWTDTYTEKFGLPGYTLDSTFFYELSAYNTEIRNLLVVDDFSITKTNTGNLPTGLSDQTSVTAPMPTAFSLQNYPNPFNAATRISIALPHNAEIHLSVYDLAGREVKELMAGSRLAGSYEIIWDGRNQEGNVASTGVYLLRLRYRAGEGGAWSQVVHRILMVK